MIDAFMTLAVLGGAGWVFWWLRPNAARAERRHAQMRRLAEEYE